MACEGKVIDSECEPGETNPLGVASGGQMHNCSRTGYMPMPGCVVSHAHEGLCGTGGGETETRCLPELCSTALLAPLA